MSTYQVNDGVIGIVFSLVYVSIKEFGVVGSDTYTWGIKDFHKCWSGSLAKRRLCLGPTCVINCTPLSALSFWVSEFVSRNAWLQQHHFANKDLCSQSYGFPNSSIRMWELDHEEGWAPKNWCFAIVVVEKTLESPLSSKEIKPVNRKGDQPWIFIGRTDAEAEAPILWPPNAKNWLIVKDPDAGKDWGQEEKGMTEDEMVGWHHWLNGHEFE